MTGLVAFMSADKGRSVKTTQPFTKGQLVCDYPGDLINKREAKKREKRYTKEGKGCYMFFFSRQAKNYCLDATAETPFFGRLINHSKHKYNLEARSCIVSDVPTIRFYAIDNLPAQTELLFDYGHRNSPLEKSEDHLLFLNY